MYIIKFIKIFLIFILFFNYSNLKADPKKNIIENINNTSSIKFNFIQISNDNNENGVCYLKRPYYLKCEYKDKNNKECDTIGINNSLGKRTPTNKLLEKSGAGNIKIPPISQIIIEIYAFFSLMLLL